MLANCGSIYTRLLARRSAYWRPRRRARRPDSFRIWGDNGLDSTPATGPKKTRHRARAPYDHAWALGARRLARPFALFRLYELSGKKGIYRGGRAEQGVGEAGGALASRKAVGFSHFLAGRAIDFGHRKGAGPRHSSSPASCPKSAGRCPTRYQGRRVIWPAPPHLGAGRAREGPVRAAGPGFDWPGQPPFFIRNQVCQLPVEVTDAEALLQNLLTKHKAAPISL